MEDHAAVSVDEFGFLRTANGARILCNPNSTYYNPASNPLPRRDYVFERRVVKPILPRELPESLLDY